MAARGTWPTPADAISRPFPVNAYEAESRRSARFFAMGHTPGARPIPDPEHNDDYPFTLDLRRPIERATLNE